MEITTGNEITLGVSLIVWAVCIVIAFKKGWLIGNNVKGKFAGCLYSLFSGTITGFTLWAILAIHFK